MTPLGGGEVCAGVIPDKDGEAGRRAGIQT